MHLSVLVVAEVFVRQFALIGAAVDDLVVFPLVLVFVFSLHSVFAVALAVLAIAGVAHLLLTYYCRRRVISLLRSCS